MTREALIRRTAHLFWYMDKSKLNDMPNSTLVEFIFNYGTWKDIKDLTEIVGIDVLGQIYHQLDEREKGNYFPEILNLYRLLLARYAPQYS